MVKIFKLALVAALLMVVSCNWGLDDEVNPVKNNFEVVEFLPAPGQFVNKDYSATTMAEACGYAQERINNRYNVSLGGFGGYIVVKCNMPISNSGGYDFGIYGNSYNGNSEPGVVWVSYDANNNGVADDEWFELYGSESDKDTTKQNYSITYSRTEDEQIIAWSDSEGASGTIERNGVHLQDYFPAWVVEREYTLSGRLLPNNSEWSEQDKGRWVLHAFEWGYADNFSKVDRESNGANYFRISDARTASGDAANLSQIDFIKVQSATNCVYSAIGEVSTEVNGFIII